jgi:hypothetical protein
LTITFTFYHNISISAFVEIKAGGWTSPKLFLEPLYTADYLLQFLDFTWAEKLVAGIMVWHADLSSLGSWAYVSPSDAITVLPSLRSPIWSRLYPFGQKMQGQMCVHAIMTCTTLAWWGHVREVDHGSDQPTKTTIDLTRGDTCDEV